MKSWPNVKLGQVGAGSNIARLAYGKSKIIHLTYLVIIGPNSHEKLT